MGFTKGEIAQAASRRTHPVKEELNRRTLRKFSLSALSKSSLELYLESYFLVGVFVFHLKTIAFS